MQKSPSFFTEELFQSLEVGEVVEAPQGVKGSAHRVYLMNIKLKPKKFKSRKNGAAVERVA